MNIRNLNDISQQLRRRIERQLERQIAADIEAHSAWEAAKLESNPGNAPLEAEPVQAKAGQRVLVRVTSVRRRLLDVDNLCEKYHVDLCRYSGIISGDSPEQTNIEVSQRKAAKGEAEHTVIEIYDATSG